MNILKDKLEAYAVSTVEDTQKVSLLDNFAISVEKAKEEADLNSQLKQGNILKDGKVSEDFCNCLFAILNHELKGKNNSIWRIAEILSPKETVHMIYRMNFKQSDKTRSEAWIRHSLNEGSMGSYFNLLIEGSNVLKDFYKPSAFVRDKTKMQSVQNLITYAISAIQFSISVEQVTSNHESLNLASSFEVVRSFTHGEQTNARRKPRGQASNIVTISDPEVFSNNGNEFESSTVKNQHSENQITLDDSVIHLNEKLTNMTVETSLGCNKCKTPEVDLIDHEKTKNTCTTIANPSSEPQNNKLIKTDQLIATPTNCIKNLSTENNLDRTCDVSSSTIDENSPINLGSELFPNLNEGNYNNNCCNDNNYNDTKTGEMPLLSSVISSSSISNEHPIKVKMTEFVPIHNTLSIMPTSTLIPSKTSAFCQVTKLNKLSVADNADNNFFSLANEQVEDLFNYNSESFADSLLNNGIENEENDEIGSKMVLDHFGYKKNADGEVGDKSNSVNGINDSEHVSNVLEFNKPLPEIHYVPGILTNENVVESSSQVTAEKPSYLSTVLSNEPKYSSQSLISKNAKISTVSKSFEQQHYITDSDSDTCSSSDRSFSILAELGISDSFIGLKEDYFSSPESFMGFSSQEELQNAIASCKELIKSSPEKSERRKELVTQLIQLRLKQQEHEELSAIGVIPHTKKVLGHQMQKQARLSLKVECDVCATMIWLLLQKAYICKDCGFHCHQACLRNLDKPCINSKKTSETTYQMEICPESGLSSQQYRCADCFHRIILKDGVFASRICDYTGLHYCHRCHWNDTLPIPARILHNWDFTPKQVCRQSKFILLSMLRKPIINLQNVNPSLFSFIEELQDVNTLRVQVILMKEYITTCRIGIQECLLLNFQNRQHFMDNSNTYSLQDLIDVERNILLEELTIKHAILAKHIKFDCPLCQGKGFVCEYCNANEIIFPFDNHVTVCSCKGTFHRLCYSKNTCPKCARVVKKKRGSDKISDAVT